MPSLVTIRDISVAFAEQAIEAIAHDTVLVDSAADVHVAVPMLLLL